MSNQIPGFLLKLYALINEPKHQEYVSWSANEKSFVIRDQEKFSEHVLPLYYKHNKMSSFVRQLNLYGFKKVLTFSQENNALHVLHNSIEFQHSFFIKNKIELLSKIKRKSVPLKIKGTIVSGINNYIVREVLRLKTSQAQTHKLLSSLQQENDYLWREIVSLRQKNLRQQDIVNHVIKFLLSVKNPEKSTKRTFSLMIGEAAEENIQPLKKGTNRNVHTLPNVQINQNSCYSTLQDLLIEEVATARTGGQNVVACAKPCLILNDKGGFINESTHVCNTIRASTSKLTCMNASDTHSVFISNHQNSNSELFGAANVIVHHSNKDMVVKENAGLTTSNNSFTVCTDILDADLASNYATFENKSNLAPLKQSSFCPTKADELCSKLEHEMGNENSSNVKDLQERLLNNEQIQLDYDLMQELFYSSTDLMPRPIPLDD